MRNRKNQQAMALLAHRDAVMVLSIAAIFILAVVYSVFSATTVNLNLDTDGTLTVDGQATFNGSVNASSTLLATGRTTLFASSSVGIASSSPTTDFSVYGAVYITQGLGVGFATTGSVSTGGTVGSGELHVKGFGVFERGLGVNGTTSPTDDFGVTGSGSFSSGLGVGYATTSGFVVDEDLLGVFGHRLGVNGTTSPYREFGVTGDVAQGSGATTTLSLSSTSGTQGGCLELMSQGTAAGTRWVRIYVGGNGNTTTNSNAVINASGRGILVIEEGRCQ